ncbi:hypothetical protein KAR28_04340 [Candidatus Parcubacteria bacterium]|nr:hypothetical protein [Candidatus Parcubacteria bacterium]
MKIIALMTFVFTVLYLWLVKKRETNDQYFGKEDSDEREKKKDQIFDESFG